jgi:hypothetical protein
VRAKAHGTEAARNGDASKPRPYSQLHALKRVASAEELAQAALYLASRSDHETAAPIAPAADDPFSRRSFRP